MKTFLAVIEEGRGGGAVVSIPFSVEEAYGTRGRVKVKATFDGHEYRGSITPMGGRHILGVRKDIRAALAKDVGDEVTVTLEKDTEPRIVEVPAELHAAFADAPNERAAFDGLSYTHRKEYARWVAEAKKVETRLRRAAQAVRMIRDGKRL